MFQPRSRLKSARFPKLAVIISGKVYRFAPNELNVKSLSVILTGPQPHYDMEVYARNTAKADPKYTDPIGRLLLIGSSSDKGNPQSNGPSRSTERS